jgi:hypothetical protein
MRQRVLSNDATLAICIEDSQGLYRPEKGRFAPKSYDIKKAALATFVAKRL